MKKDCIHLYKLPEPSKSVGDEFTVKCLKCNKKQLHRNYHSTNSSWQKNSK